MSAAIAFGHSGKREEDSWEEFSNIEVEFGAPIFGSNKVWCGGAFRMIPVIDILSCSTNKELRDNSLMCASAHKSMRNTR